MSKVSYQSLRTILFSSLYYKTTILCTCSFASFTQLQHMDTCLDTLSNELCQVNTYVGYIAWRQVAISGFTAYTSPSPLASEDESDEGSNSDDEMSTWFTYPLSLMTKRGSSFDWYESSHIHRGRVSIGDFCDKGSVYTIRDVVRFLCIFSFLSFTFTSCILVLWPFDIHCT